MRLTRNSKGLFLAIGLIAVLLLLTIWPGSGSKEGQANRTPNGLNGNSEFSSASNPAVVSTQALPHRDSSLDGSQQVFHGIVRRKGGEPIPGAQVFALEIASVNEFTYESEEEPTRRQPDALTADDGEFRFGGAKQPSALLVRLESGQFTIHRSWKNGDAITIGDAPLRRVDIFDFSGKGAPGVTVSLRRLAEMIDPISAVRMPITDPIERAAVPMLYWSATSDSNGGMDFSGLVPGVYWADVRMGEKAAVCQPLIVDLEGHLFLEVDNPIRVSGRVLSLATGLPLQGADVRIIDLRSHSPRSRVSRTDATGYYEMDVGLRGFSFGAVVATAKGFARAIEPAIEVSVKGSIERNFRLEKAVDLGGRVIDDRGVSVVGAVVAIRRDASGPVLSRRYTGSDGGFSFDDAPSEGALLISVGGAGCANKDVYVESRGLLREPIIVERGGTVIIELHNVPPLETPSGPFDWKIKYSLEDRRSGSEPFYQYLDIRNQENQVGFKDNESGALRTSTLRKPEEGALPPAAGGELALPLRLKLQTYAPGRHTIGVRVPLRVAENKLVQVPSGSEIVVPIHLKNGLDVRGRVIFGRDGTPISGIDVCPMEPRDLNGAWGLQLDYRKTVTNSDGTFELRNMPVGLTDICVWDAKRGIVRVVQVLVPEHPPHDIGDIPAFTYANISGKVHSSMALPADLVVAVFDGNDRFCGEMSIDGSGSFRTEALLGGRFQLELRRRGERGLSLARIPVDLEEEELKHVDLYYGPAQLQGSIVPMPSREGGALWEVQLSRSDNGQLAARREIDPYGRFEIQGLSPGKYQVEARAYAGPKRAVATAQVELKEGRNEVIIRRAGTQADLRVVDSKGEPVNGAMMRARRIGSPPVLLGDTDEKGELRIEDLEPGTLTFSLRAPGFEEVFRSTLALKPNSQETQVIRLARESLLTVRTLDLRDRPLSAAQVRVSRLDGMAPRTLLESTDGLGSVQFQKLGAGEHTIFVKPAGRGFPVKLVRNLAAESSHLETLKIRNTGTLEVRVLNKEGVAISDVAVDATVQGVEGSLSDWTADGWVEVESGSAVTDSQGKLIIRRFPEGQVTVSAPGAVPALATVKPSEAATATLLMP